MRVNRPTPVNDDVHATPTSPLASTSSRAASARADTLDLLSDASYALRSIDLPEDTAPTPRASAPRALDADAIDAFERRVSELTRDRDDTVRRVDVGREILHRADARESSRIVAGTTRVAIERVERGRGGA